MDHVVVVGASLAGLRACEQLRTSGFAGTVTLIGAEPHLPYDRPPLSKKLLAGESEPDRIHLRKPTELDTLRIDTRFGVSAVGLDTLARRVSLDDGSTVPYDGLVIATGAAPRRLPGQPDAAGVHVLRTLDHALALRAELVEGRRVVVIGAGFIGLEVAATARTRGCQVVVLEGAPAPMIRGLGAAMGTAVAAVHERHGVDVRCGVQVAAIETGASGVRGVSLVDGTLVRADVVLVGVGVAPVTEWLAGSGLTVRDGVVCDETLWTGAPGVYAAGDCARWMNPLFGDLQPDPAGAPGPDGAAAAAAPAGEEMRVEHWTNAAEQGAAAAANLLATTAGEPPTPYAPVPFFWSDQFESRIQFVGRAAGAPDEVVEVVAGDPSGPFVALYGHRGRLRGALGVSMPRLVMPYRKLLAARASWDEAIAHSVVT
ncbi:MAG: ferredoxin reductase [Ilumatobacteraceae bacterium]|nr:ferredoxin reductase [Ilumatobacteraceae bacterium]